MKPWFPQTHGQVKYALAMRGPKPIVIVHGPAGTGKTLAACSYAVQQSKKIVLCRPLVSVDGEELGSLPGDIGSKMAPWTRPAMAFLETQMTRAQLEQRVQIEPLGFMRGRTYENSVVIADEMQNASVSQFKMLLTRLGYDTKLILSGDVAQSDLCDSDNGLKRFVDENSHLDCRWIQIVALDSSDICRHPAVEEILSLYR